MIAKAIHLKSTRKDSAFIKVDVGAISESLFESEMFGHKQGAFTDAREDRTGRLLLADNGSLFLDEIGNLSIALQAKLLTALQHKEIIPVGENRPIKINCRIITATNEDLDAMVREKTFREDLLYRLNTVAIQVPSLRERSEDIPLLADHFLSVLWSEI